MKTASVRTALIATAIVAIGAFALLSIGGADAQQACIQSLAGNGTVNGTWDNTCLSENTPLSDGDYDYPVGTRYARFYTFTLSAPSTVTLELKSSVDTYMYLMQGTGKTGTIDDSDDDISNEDTNSRISKTLPVGDYTIEATTFGIEATGTFTLTVSGLPDASTPTVTPTTSAGDTPTVTPTPISGQDTPTPTPTSTPTRTPTPVPTTVPTDVLNRLSALETLAVRQQGLISTLEGKITALDSRVATLEAGASNPAPSSDPCRIARPSNVNLHVTLHDFWDKRDSCLIGNYRRLRDQVEHGPVFVINGEHRHGFDDTDDGGHYHEIVSRVRDPHNHSLYKYDTFIAVNPDGTPWQTKLEVPVGGLYPLIYVNEYNPQTDEWHTVASSTTDLRSLGLVATSVTVEWTPISGKAYSVTATLARGFTESPFTLTYYLSRGNNSQGSQPQIVPTDLTPPQLQSLQKAIEGMRVEHDGR